MCDFCVQVQRHSFSNQLRSLELSNTRIQIAYHIAVEPGERVRFSFPRWFHRSKGMSGNCDIPVNIAVFQVEVGHPDNYGLVLVVGSHQSKVVGKPVGKIIMQ